MDRSRAIALAEELYRALAVWDVASLNTLLHPRLQGRTTAGLPLDLGGSYDGPEVMMRDFYSKIGRNYDARAVPESFSVGDDGKLVVHGQYVGHARPKHGGGELRAEFVHLLGFRDERIVSIEQITDSHAWHEALKQPGDAR
jgi:2-(1,2-epoxy-1,2-dihydrophenyl)acetyl-CoA isomerase